MQNDSLRKVRSDDLLNMEKFDNTPHPIFVSLSGSLWPLVEVCVETGLGKVDVCGMLDNIHWGSVTKVVDGEGVEHCSDDFYLEED